MLKSLIFDLDGTLTNSTVYRLTTWSNLAKELGVNLIGERLNSLRGTSRMDSLNLILKYGNQENKHSEAEKEKFAVEKNTEFIEQVKEIMPADILPGIPELLSDAKKQNLETVIASASKNTPKILTKLGIMDELDGIVDPATLHQGKPDPEIYEKAQKLLGLDAGEAISFGGAQTGVQSVKSAGQFAVGIGDKEVLEETNYIIPTIKELELSEIESVFNKK